MTDLPDTTAPSRLFFRPGPGWSDIEGRQRAAIGDSERAVAAAEAAGNASRTMAPAARPSFASSASRSQDRAGIAARPSSFLASPDGRSLFLRSGSFWRDQGGGLPGRWRAVLNDTERRWRDVKAEGAAADHPAPALGAVAPPAAV